MSATLVVQERPICNHECPEKGYRRCHKTAVRSYDGVWLCDGCEKVSEVVRYAHPVEIVWRRR